MMTTCAFCIWTALMIGIAIGGACVTRYHRSREAARRSRVPMALDLLEPRPTRRLRGHATTRSGSTVYCDMDLKR